MKFAVIGLCDYQNPIDHMLGGFNALSKALNCNGNIAHGYNYIDLMEKIDSIIYGNYDVVIVGVTNIEAIYDIVVSLQIIRNKTKIICCSDAVHGRIEYSNTYHKIKLFDIFNNLCDIVWPPSNVDKDYLSTILDVDKRVVVFGFPIDIIMIEQLSEQSVINRESDLILLGYISDLYFHNIIYAMKIIQKLGFRSLVFCFESNIDRYTDVINKYGMKDFVIIQKSVLQPDYISYGIARCQIALSLMVRCALGKTAAECAVVGVPSIGSANYFQIELFPSLAVNDKGGLLEEHSLRMVQKYMVDEDARKKVCNYARQKVEYYRIDKFADKFISRIM